MVKKGRLVNVADTTSSRDAQRRSASQSDGAAKGIQWRRERGRRQGERPDNGGAPERDLRPVTFLSGSLKDFQELPDSARRRMGYALYKLQCGETPDPKEAELKPLVGGLSGFSELKLRIRKQHERGGFRVVVRMAADNDQDDSGSARERVVVVDCFQKKTDDLPDQEVKRILKRWKTYGGRS